MEKNSNTGKVFIISGIYGILSAILFGDGFLLMCMYTFHEGYEWHFFLKTTFYTSGIALFLMTLFCVIVLIDRKKKGKKIHFVGNIKRIVIGAVIGFVSAYVLSSLIYQWLGII